jgi:hypothetical protein
MTIHNPIPGKAPGLPIARPAKPTPPRPAVLSAEEWAELHDCLSLALDALGDRPQDFNSDFLRQAVANQRLALQLSHRALAKVRV